MGEKEGLWEKKKGYDEAHKGASFCVVLFSLFNPSLKLFPISLFKKIQCSHN